MKDFLQSFLMLGGALVGGVVGHMACTWVYHQGYYGMIIPGGLVALGASMFRTNNPIVPGVCAAWAAMVGLFTEWSLAPFKADPSFSYFLAHVPSLRPVTLLMIAAGTILAFFMPLFRWERNVAPASRRSSVKQR